MSINIVVGQVVLLVALLTVADAMAQSDVIREVVTISMEDQGGGQWRFDPEKIVVTRGTVVQFIQTDVVPHNVEFNKIPKGTQLGDAKMGPFLMAKGETYDIVIDDRFAIGVHEYICTPHVTMGMKGVIKVE